MTLPGLLNRYVSAMWQKKGLASTLLLPLSWLYGAVIAIRRRVYRHFPSRRYRSPVPVLVVGNIYIGGTGKTPVVIAVVQALQQSGWRPGVVSRGYGTDIKGPPRVTQGVARAAWLGDEPALIARTTQAPVAVHPRRASAVRALLRAHPDTGIIVADDGLQHLALARDVEIIVQDERTTGNGRLLPAGPLRESAQRLKSVDLVISHQTASTENCTADPSEHTLVMRLQPFRAVALAGGQAVPWEEWVTAHRSGRHAAVAGIGHPHRFFRMLQDDGLVLAQTVSLPDHGTMTAALLDRIDADTILITAKDAVKCQGMQDHRIWVVEVQACFSRPDWLPRLLAQKGIDIKAHQGITDYTDTII